MSNKLKETKPETASAVNALVSVPELMSLAEMIREQPKVDRLLGNYGAVERIKELVYKECADYVERLARGDKSVIEKM